MNKGLNNQSDTNINITKKSKAKLDPKQTYYNYSTSRITSLWEKVQIHSASRSSQYERDEKSLDSC